MLKSKDPHLHYELVLNTGSGSFELDYAMEEYSIGLKAMDYLTNSEICS